MMLSYVKVGLAECSVSVTVREEKLNHFTLG